jgi:release factor glutamine methyltransferase
MTDIEYLNKYLPEEKLEDGLSKLKQGIPVQYIVGDINFYGFNIKVNPNVLIPRPETELLVEKTVNYIKDYFGSIHVKVIDLGTGSGAIAIALKKNLNCSVTAVDISNDALDVARENACLNAADITFYEGDMLENITDKYDVIISNPPYIKTTEKIDACA